MSRRCTKCKTVLSPGDSFCGVCGAQIDPGADGGGQSVIGPGSRIREYEFMRLLGQGAVGRVYLARNHMSGREVAVKVVVPSLTTASTVRQRFLSGGRITAGLEHPNIVRVHTFFEEQGCLFLVMEYLRGKPLDRMIQEQGRLHPQEAVRIAAGILEALEYAHTQKPPLVHRDIKPANILVDPGKDGRVVVTDFDIAKFQGTKRETQHGSFVGTPSYVAPEQAKGGAPLPSSDLYSVGITLFEMLTGHVPYGQEGDDFLGVLYKHVHSPIPRLAQRPDLPKRVCRVVEKTLAKEPEERHASATSLREALQSAASSKGVLAGLPLAGLAGLVFLLVAIGLGALHHSGKLDEWSRALRKIVRNDDPRRHRRSDSADGAATAEDLAVSTKVSRTDLVSHPEPIVPPAEDDEEKTIAVVFEPAPAVTETTTGRTRKNREFNHGKCVLSVGGDAQEAADISRIRAAVERGTRDLDESRPDVTSAAGEHGKARKLLDSGSPSVWQRCADNVDRLKQRIKDHYLYLVKAASESAARQEGASRSREKLCRSAWDRSQDARGFGATDSELSEALGICQSGE